MMAAIMMIGTAAAQSQRTDVEKGGKREKPTVEQMAKMRTDRMAKELNLTQEQQKQLYDLNLTNISAAQKKAESARSDMEAARKSNDAQMQKILTPDQYQKWGEMQKRHAEMGRAKGQHGGWRGQGPKGPDGPKGPAPEHRHGKGKKGGPKGDCCKDKGECHKGKKPADRK